MRSDPGSQRQRLRGLEWLLNGLQAQPGQTWQQRWQASGAEAAGTAWRQIFLLRDGDDADVPEWRKSALSSALAAMISADYLRPSLPWLTARTTGQGTLARELARSRDPEGFTRLRNLCDNDPDVSVVATSHTLHRAAVILAAKGGLLADITVGDVLELLNVEANLHVKTTGHTAVFYRMLHRLVPFTAPAPPTLRELGPTGQLTPAELIDRYHLHCRPIRDLLVDYLRERQPALDYVSLKSLAHILGKRFWADIEHHHPGIDTLRLPIEVADGWKQRLQTKTKTVTNANGEKTEVAVERINYRESLTPVRAFYLDLAQWAIEDPARWAHWVAPCPIREAEVSLRKAKRRRKARIDARTRERLPVLPVLVNTVKQRRMTAQVVLATAQRSRPGETFNAAGQTLVRSITPNAHGDRIGVDDPATGKRRDLTHEEDYAFWTFAVVEVLRATGIRIEELLELSHHSLVQYRLPTTGEVVPLLQIAPSKTDQERLLVVSPELADVLSSIIHRIREASGAVPLVPAYDRHECVWMEPAPLLFQRRIHRENRAIGVWLVRRMLDEALEHTGLIDPATSEPLRYTPHDFRRLFITDAVMNGLPPHIAQVIAGHRDINVTMGYKAVYADEAIQSHLAFLSRRRALRPTEEYRVPTDEEWTEFLGHFERRKVSTGTCGRAFGTPCIHEHACIRCSMLWPDPAQRDRLIEIRDNLISRVAEAEREGWLGEIEGLQISLAGAKDKLTQIDRRSPGQVDLGIPTLKPAQNDPSVL
jgi:integrase